MFFNKFLTSIYQNSFEFDIKEDLELFELNIYTSSIIEDTFVDTFFNTICSHDCARIEVDYFSELGFDPDKTFDSSTGISEWESYISSMLDGEVKLRLKFTINKKIIENKVSIYSLQDFTKYLDKNIKALLNIFQNWSLDKDVFLLEVQDQLNKIYFQSNLFIIFSVGNTHSRTATNLEIRKKIAFRRDKYTNPHNLNGYTLLPSDFHNIVDIKDNCDSATKLLHIINHLKNILSMSFLSNTTRVEEDNIEMSIFDDDFLHINDAYKNIVIINADVIYEIYCWIYEEEFSVEKLTIARPIVARNFSTFNGEWFIDTATHKSIKSAYTTFLKKNVEQYFQTVNKASDLAADIFMKNREIVKFAASSFRGNSLVVLSYFISIFIFNSLSNNFNTQIFDGEKYYISLVFLLISASYLLISYKQFNSDIHASKEHFTEIKQMYSDPLLIKEDLDKVFNQDKFDNKIIETTKESKRYFYLWIIEITILTMMVIILTLTNS